MMMLAQDFFSALFSKILVFVKCRMSDIDSLIKSRFWSSKCSNQAAVIGLLHSAHLILVSLGLGDYI